MNFFRKEPKTESSGADAVPPPPRGRVLVVEDDPTTCELVRRILVRAGYEVATVADGSEALLESKRFSPDVMILDLMLPSTDPGGGQFDGFGVLQWLNTRVSKLIPTIVLTCRQDEASRRQAASLGAGKYLTKPFQTQDLIRAVEESISRE
jgi:DNA-binding response OmpR family regulator